MSRHDREAKLEALYGGRDGLTLITERGGRKRDHRKVLTDRLSKMMAEQPQPGTDVHQPSSAPVMGSYQKGTLEGGISEGVEAIRNLPERMDRRGLLHNRFDIPVSEDIVDIFNRSKDWEENPEDKMAARFMTGRSMAGKGGALKSTVSNVGYEALKGLSQALGLKKVLGAPDEDVYDIDETTSPASWKNALAAQAGIMSDFFYPDKLPQNETQWSGDKSKKRLREYMESIRR